MVDAATWKRRTRQWEIDRYLSRRSNASDQELIDAIRQILGLDPLYEGTGAASDRRAFDVRTKLGWKKA